MFSRVRLLLTISIGLLILAACGGPVEPDTGFEVSVTLVGDGHVTSDPAGIDTADGKSAANFAENDSVVLTAVPTGNATFTNWTGNAACEGSTDLVCTIDDLTADVTITANFTEDVEPGKDITYAINVVNGGSATGTVTSSTGEVTDCAFGDTCEDTAAENTTVTLEATLTSDNTLTGFAGWTGGECEGVKTLTCAFTAQEGIGDVTANFNDISSETIDVSEVVEELISDSTDDSTAFPAGHNYNHSSDLDINYDAAHGTQQWIGLRFDFADLTDGARIQSAVIKMSSDVAAVDETTVQLTGEAVAAPAPFQDDADETASKDASTRAENPETATTPVDWNIIDPWTAGQAVTTPDISSIVQEVVSNPDYTWQQSLVIFVSPDADTTSTAARGIANPTHSSADPIEDAIEITVEYVALPVL